MTELQRSGHPHDTRARSSVARRAALNDLRSIGLRLPRDSSGDEKKLRFAMKIGGDYDVYPRFNRWPALAKELGLDPDRLVDRVRELSAAAPDALSAAAGEPDVKALGRSISAKLVDLVAERARRCGALISAGPA